MIFGVFSLSSADDERFSAFFLLLSTDDECFSAFFGFHPRMTSGFRRFSAFIRG